MLAGVLALAACSTIKLGYENLPRLMAWQADRYLALDDDQEAILARHARALQQWHRHDQLPVYADFLGRIEAELRAPVTAGQVAAWREQALTAWPPLADRLAPAVAEIGVGLRPAQLAQLQQTLAKANEKSAREYRPADPVLRRAARERRLTERAEGLLGDLSDAQRDLIRRSVQDMPVNEDAWWRVRLARQKAVVDLLASLAADKPEPVEATRRARAVLATLVGRHEAVVAIADGSAPEREALGRALAASSAAGDRLTADLLALATPDQKRQAIRRLNGYREDFALLASR